jgi:hypothetical protein
MQKILFCLACLVILVLAQPAVAQEVSSAATARADLKSVPQVGLSVFLASLAGAPSNGEITTQSDCFQGWCQLAHQQCAEDCAPCGSSTTCYYYVCDSFCSCLC